MNTLLLLLALSITPEQLVDQNVYVETATHEGSGVLFTRDQEAYVLTVGHVVASAKTEEGFDDVDITFTKDDFTIKAKATVLAFSDDEHDDLALLHVHAPGVFRREVVFGNGSTLPIGTELYHVGNLSGKPGLNSLTTGIVSFIGREMPLTTGTFDQVSVTAFPGSSGGGVYLKTGELVGVISRLRGPNFAAMIPIRRIRAWCKEEGVEWAVDPCEPTPAETE